MLTLTRRPGQSIFIGDDVEVFVTMTRGGEVRLSFAAPPNVRILRSELRRKTAESGAAPVEAEVVAEDRNIKED